MPRPNDVGDQLAAWAKAVRVTTRGRVTGRQVAVTVGFVEEPDGSLLVAAGDPESDWSRNLESDPVCRVSVGDREWGAVAEPLDAAEAGRVVAQLILRYGTPAERLGRGPAFRLRRVDAGPGPGSD